MAEIKLGKVALTPAGVYNAETTYMKLDFAFTDDSSYVSLQDNNKGHAVTDTAWWQKLADGTAATTAAENANAATTSANNAAAKANAAATNADTVRENIQADLNGKVDKVSGKQLSSNDYTTTEKNKLASIAEGAQVNTITGVKGNSESTYRTGNVNITTANIGLGNVNNTSDADKPVSTAQQTALDKKVDKVTGKVLSTNDFTNEYKSKLDNMEEQVLRQVAWGIPIKQSIQSSTNYGVIGNTAAWTEYKLYCGRYLVTNDGRAAKLSHTNSAVFADGTTVDETKGHVMWIGPRLYYRVQTDSVSGVPVLWLSMLPIGGEFIGGANGGMYNCIGAYKGSMSGSALVSRSGVAPAGNKTINASWTAAQVNGKEWGLTDYDQRKLIMMLGLSEYGDTNIQAKLGYGVCGSSSMDLWVAAASLQTGATKNLGDNWGKIAISVVNGSDTGVNCSRVNMMGIEDPYGWQWEMLQGVFCGNSNNTAQDGTEIFVYKGNRLPTTAELAAHPNGEYRQATRQTDTGQVQEIILGEHFDILHKKIGGSSTSYWADYSWGNNTGQLVLWGGSANNGAYCGLASAYSHFAWSYSNAAVGSRLAYFGDLTFVSGASLMAA